MASLRQIQANRRNARKSTGPTSVEGKDRCRRNALRHGLAGAGDVTPEGETAAVVERAALWGEWLRPSGEPQTWLVRKVALHSLQMDRCVAHEEAVRALEAERAGLHWEEDRLRAAEELGATLAKNPPLIARRLAATKQGCDWLIARWETLAAELESLGAWDAPHRSHALDLLGVPSEFRNTPAPFDAPEGGDALTHALHAIADEIARLDAFKADALDDLDAEERAAARVGFGPGFSRDLTLLRRYEAACSRRFDASLKRLRDAQRHAPTAERPSEPRVERPAPAQVATPAPPKVATPAPAPSPAQVPAPVRPAPIVVPREKLADAIKPAPAPSGNRRDRRARKALARRKP